MKRKRVNIKSNINGEDDSNSNIREQHKKIRKLNKKEEKEDIINNYIKMKENDDEEKEEKERFCARSLDYDGKSPEWLKKIIRHFRSVGNDPNKKGYIEFNESEHTYKVDGVETIGSSSSIANPFLGEFDQEKMAKSLAKGRKYKMYTDENWGGILTDVDDIIDYWELRTNDGSIIHAMCENYINMDDMDLIEKDQSHRLYPQFKHCIPKLKQYLKKWGIQLSGIIPEKKIYMKKPFIAGMIDALCFGIDIKTGKLVVFIIDWKRCKSPNWVDWHKKTPSPPFAFKTTTIDGGIKERLIKSTHLKHSVQLWVYKIMLESCFQIPGVVDFKNVRLFNWYFEEPEKGVYKSWPREAIDIESNVREALNMFVTGKVKFPTKEEKKKRRNEKHKKRQERKERQRIKAQRAKGNLI